MQTALLHASHEHIFIMNTNCESMAYHLTNGQASPLSPHHDQILGKLHILHLHISCACDKDFEMRCSGKKSTSLLFAKSKKS